MKDLRSKPNSVDILLLESRIFGIEGTGVHGKQRDETVSRRLPCQGVLFDMDGVVVDTHTSVTAFWEKLADAYHVNLTPDDFKTHIYGCTALHTLEHLFPKLSVEEQQSVFNDLATYEDQLIYEPIPGILALLEKLRQHRIPTVLVTGATTRKAQAVSQQLGLDGLFKMWITGSQIQLGKPHPEGYISAAAAISRGPKDCLVFEDAVNGVKAAVAAGMQCVGINGQDMAPMLLTAGAYVVIQDFTKVQVQSLITLDPGVT